MNLRFLLVLSAAFMTQHVIAEPGDLDEKQYLLYKKTAKDLRCPTCTGLSVLESDARFSVQIKDLVEEKVKEGKSKQEILDFFESRYGPWILREPPKKGVNLLAWLFPIGLMVVGPIVIWFTVWRKRKNVETFGLRTSEDILNEFRQKVSQAKGGAS